MEDKFKEITTGKSDDVVIRVYQDIDNGGYSISGDKFGSLSIDFSFFGMRILASHYLLSISMG